MNPENQNSGNKSEDNNNEYNNLRRYNNSNNALNPIISPVVAGFIGLFGGFFLYQIVGGILTLIVFGLDIENAPVNGFRLMTMAGQILFILSPALLFSKWFYKDVTNVIRFKPAVWKEIGLFVIGIIILTPMLENFVVVQNFLFEKLASSSPAINSAKEFFDSLNDKVESTYSNLLTIHSLPEGFLVVLVVAAVPAVCEEVMFRGFIQKSFELRIKPIWAILITGVFFGCYHFNPYGLIPLIALGVYFGFAVYMSDSIFVSIALHFLNNFFAIMVFFYIGKENIISSTDSDPQDIMASFRAFLFLAILFSLVLYVIINYYKKKRNS
ncbi:MAG TPA: CPBP family intramembrane glutamic endopeptidase [Ignavibacteriaceae bacterium]|nr:CPBP family intramembrane glutamic endopeptidase [Ignavibacteriaceae bacterium]